MASFFGRTALAGARVRSDVQQVSRPGEWAETGQQFLVAQKKRAKTAGVRLSPRTTTTALRIMAAAAPAVADALNETLIPVAVRAFNQWPIKTGESKSKLFLKFSVLKGQRYRGRVEDLADYAAVINRGRTADELVFKPGKEAAKKAAKLIGRNIVRRVG